LTRRQIKKKTAGIERRAKKQWRHLSTTQQNVMIAGAFVQISLFTAAQIDIARRPAEEVRGKKLFWRFVVLISFIGPLAYFAFGRTSAMPTTSPKESVAQSDVA
jgi:hypothetical protein